MAFSEYPKQMHHPGYRPAVVVKWDPKLKPEQQARGRPPAFPDVAVNNADQETEYAAKGYVPLGVPDPEAYRLERTGLAPKSEAFVEYPKWIHRMKGGELESKIIHDSEEQRQAGPGWYGNPAEAREAADRILAEEAHPANTTAPAKRVGRKQSEETKEKIRRSAMARAQAKRDALVPPAAASVAQPPSVKTRRRRA